MSLEYLRGRYGIPYLYGACFDKAEGKTLMVVENQCKMTWRQAVPLVYSGGGHKAFSVLPNRTAAYHLSINSAKLFQALSEFSHAFLNDLSPDSLCVDPSQDYEVTLRDVRDLLYHDGPLALNISTPHLRDTPCTAAGRGQPVAGGGTVPGGCQRSSALHRAGCQDPEKGTAVECKVAPEADGVCDKETRRCMPYTSKTHVYDLGKRPWLYPSLAKFLPRLQVMVVR